MTLTETSPSSTGAANVRRHPVRATWERFDAIFTFPGLYDFSDILPGSTDTEPTSGTGSSRRTRRGRATTYPDLLLFALAISTRAHSSQNLMLAEIQEPGRWTRLCDLYCAGVGSNIDLPAVAPSAHTLDRFMKRLAQDTPEARRRWRNISDRFAVVGWGTARVLGNFADDYDTVDWTRPNYHHAVIGDGTYIRPLSDVVRTWCPVTGEEIILNSRATDPKHARIQEQLTDPAPDDKTARGLNHVTLSTWTDYGWVVLGTDHATGGEIHPTMALLGRLLDLAQGRVHTVVWDRVLTGWAIQHLLATRRVLVINKPVARQNDRRFTVDGEHFRPYGISRTVAIDRHKAGLSLPLGTSIYQTTKGYERVNSQFYRLDTPAALETCARQHTLWVDDGALFDTYLSDDGVWWKRPKAATAVQAVPIPRADDLWSLPITWHLPCPEAPHGRHEFTTHWNPEAGRSSAPARGNSKALSELRPIPRNDEARFDNIHGLRNITESFNQWFQKTLGQHKRAMHLDIAQQAIDHLCAGMLSNAITYYRYLRIHAEI